MAVIFFGTVDHYCDTVEVQLTAQTEPRTAVCMYSIQATHYRQLQVRKSNLETACDLFQRTKQSRQNISVLLGSYKPVCLYAQYNLPISGLKSAFYA